MYIAVYGSLRKNNFNHRTEWFKKAQFIKKMSLNGFEMYDIGFYPIIVPTKNRNKTVEVEIYEVPNFIFMSIKRMEINAGYNVMDINVAPNINAKLFYYNHVPKYARLISDGVWKEPTLNNIELDIMSDDDELELKKLIKDYPHLKNDPEVQEYLKEHPAILNDDEMDVIDDDWLKDSDSYSNELDSILAQQISLDDEDDDFLYPGGKQEGYSKKANYETPDYNLEKNYPCICTAEGIKPSWEWDKHIGVWRCSKCGEIQ